jgi:hypothetical protein
MSTHRVYYGPTTECGKVYVQLLPQEKDRNRLKRITHSDKHVYFYALLGLSLCSAPTRDAQTGQYACGQQGANPRFGGKRSQHKGMSISVGVIPRADDVTAVVNIIDGRQHIPTGPGRYKVIQVVEVLDFGLFS